jgi:hypothetical protein
MWTHRIRIATVVPGSAEEVRRRLDGLPPTTTVRISATSAGVVVTLERTRRGPVAWRRRTIRTLRRQLAAATAGDASIARTARGSATRAAG